MNPFYWDLNDGTRAFAKRFAERHPQNNYPNDMQAGVYASVIHYLKAVDKAGGAVDGKAVVAAMKAMPTDDPLFGKGTIRADGRKIHPSICCRSRRRTNSSRNGICSRWSQPFRGTRRSVPRAKGTARSSRSESRAFSSEACPALDAGWIPVRVKKTRQNKKVELRSD